MSKITLIVGGVRSGKSNHAVELAKESMKDVVFLATCQAYDDEMRQRINLHKQSRPSGWGLIEENLDLAGAITKQDDSKILLVDCLGLWMSNLLMQQYDEGRIKKEIDILIDSLKLIKCEIIFVSNEVGMGIVPESYLGRVFRDYLGLLNQKIALIADEVIVMHVGIPLKIK